MDNNGIVNEALTEQTDFIPIQECRTVAEIRSSLAELSIREAKVTAQLDALLASQIALSRELGRLDLLRASLGSQAVATRAISHGILSGAASTAARISSAVKRLDREQDNVKATLAMVEQVAELKACVLGVHGSMGAPQDWETAAMYLFRASQVPADVIDGAFAEQIVPTTEVPDPPRVTLDNAAESLCGLFLREFEKATTDGDGTRVTRFFKLFPLIGRAEVGLDAYGRYVCQGVSARARQNMNTVNGAAAKRDGFFYAYALTKLFEHIAQIIDAHEPVVQRHYGAGQMTRVIERLQIEADVQGGIILDSWFEESAVDRKLTDIKSYAFSFLVQSFLSAQKAGMVRSDSPAHRKSTELDDDSIDTKAIDGILNESGTMLGRWALYSRFLASKSAPTALENEVDGLHATSALVMPKYLLTSNLLRKITSHLLNPFIAMTVFMVRASLEKAFQLDEPPHGLTLNINRSIQSQPPFITSAVDDVMYVVAQMLNRAINTSQRAVIASVVPTIGRVLSSDFIGMIQRKMRDESYPRPVMQGALPPEDLVIQFLVLINNLDVSTAYIKRIIATHVGTFESSGSTDGHALETPPNLQAIFPFNDDVAFTAAQLRSMESTFSSKCMDVLNEGINVVFRQVVKPRIRPMLADAFRDVDYAIRSNEDSASENDEEGRENIVPARFASTYNAVIRPMKRIMTTTTFDALLHVSLPSFADTLERRLWAMQGRISELGAVRLERDLAGIVAGATRDGKYELRNVFSKCTEIAMIAGMEKEEWEELIELEREGGDLGREWMLDGEERRRARALVVH